jgi:hypothetical protein
MRLLHLLAALAASWPAPAPASPAPCTARATACESIMEVTAGSRGDYVMRLDLDAAGRELERRYYPPGESEPTTVYRYAHDAQGRKVLEQTFRGGALVFEVTTTWSRDGSRAMRSFDTDGDGKIDRTERFRYERDSEGRVTREARLDPSGRWRTTLTTYRPDGRIETITELDEAGRPWRVIRYTFDAMGGAIEQLDLVEGRRNAFTRYANTYDACGNVLTRFTDLGGDGRLDWHETFRYRCDAPPP